MKTYSLSATFSGLGDLRGDAADFSDGFFRLENRNLRLRLLRPKPGTLVAIWGAPALDGRIDDAKVAARIAGAPNLEDAARSLNGSFLIFVYDLDRHSFSVVNDRFGAKPFFYTFDGRRFCGAASFKELFDRVGAGASRGLDPQTVFEFLYFRRVFGTKTYDRSIQFLPFASILTIGAGDAPKLTRYWRPDFEKLSLSRSAFAGALAEAIRDSVALYTSDMRRFGLMLSGGLDARGILAASDKAPVCFTTAPRQNNEVSVAAELAAIAGAEHLYVPRPERFLDDVLDGSVYLSGGMTVFSEVQFAGYEAAIAPRADAVMLGLGFDIMFCGHYLPKAHPRFFGRPAWYFELQPLGADIVRTFVESASYRLKTSDPFLMVRNEKRKVLADHIYASVAEAMKEGREYGAQGYDLWEFMHLHNFARHYSFLMAASIEPYAEARIPSMENRLYDLVCSMPVAYKANWDVYVRALTNLSPRLMNVRNANTNITARYSLHRQTVIKFARAVSNRILGTRFPATPAWWDRSWPEPRQAIDANPRIRAAVGKLSSSERLASLGIFDMGAIAAAADDHENGRHDHAVLLNLLLTIDLALAPQGEAAMLERARA